ncbi:putative oligomycin resistance ATP-dependent permease yor1 [Microdochium trichocladiopsis]|uniref:Oligomycin resistance ATP-dependent permease yor1 n=1 Tax=Microdochium trichocladiopsis TaxID=1682393 RepID=A0A9P8YFI8_9PEZI|nr:putative oligomycin resistance ATP-dependent permease yor1 [Microdochium trichocladiopsis]KAH7039561.1 putative oligomycin resistance ATP-dependent permease yor1 [Microdochium trichocladiopsis]
MVPKWLRLALQPNVVPDIPTERVVSAERDASTWSKLWFTWLSPLMSAPNVLRILQAGYIRRLERTDIWTVSEARLVKPLAARLRQSLAENQLAGRRQPLLWTVYSLFKTDFWLTALCQFLVATFQVLTPFALRFLIVWVQQAYLSRHDGGNSLGLGAGIGYVLGISGMQVVQNLAASQFQYRGMLLGGQIRSTIIAAAFVKSLQLSNRARAGGSDCVRVRADVRHAPNKDHAGKKKAPAQSPSSEGWANGRVMNLISTDTSRIEQAAAVIHLTWISVYQVTLTIALLIFNLGWAAAIGAVVLMLGLVAVTSGMRPLIASRARITKHTDKRVTLTQEVFQAIRFVKYFSWETFFLGHLKAIRAQESHAVRIMHLIRCAIGGLAQFLPVLATMTTFIVFAGTYGTLEPATVFSSLAMLNLLRIPANWIPVSANLVVDAFQSLKRIEEFLSAEEVNINIATDQRLPFAVRIDGASFTWEFRPSVADVHNAPENDVSTKSTGAGLPVGADSVDSPFALRNVTIEHQRGDLVAIIGSVGSGKSSLLSALAGDMRQTGGQMHMSAGKAYCPQQAWIQNATVRDNILFGKSFDEPLYLRVVAACALVPDFETLPHGDMTEIGERGITLSGGQKQRVSIARAIYSEADIVLLDDPLSAVDANVGKHIFEQAICGLLRSKTGFLATHHLHLLPRCDGVIWMVEGRIEDSGGFSDIVARNPEFLRLMAFAGHTASHVQVADNDGTAAEESAPTNDGGSATQDDEHPSTVLGSLGQLMQEESEITDSVSLSVYMSWLRSSGTLWNALPVLVGQCLFRASSIIGGLWLSWWVDNRYGLTQAQNIGIYAGISLAQIVLLFTSSLITCVVCIKAGQVMSDTALWQTLRAPIALYDVTPLGRMIYRFTRDIDALDNNLVVAVQQLLINGGSLIGSYALIVAYFYYFVIAVIMDGLAVWWCISYYRSSAREIRRHQLVLDGIVFARFNEALVGASCIRAYAQESYFIQRVHEAIDDMDSAYYLSFASHNWLSVRLDNIGIVLSFVTGMLIITKSLPVSPSISSLLLTYSIAMVGIMQTVVKYLIELNNAMSNTERLLEYTNSLEQEAPLDGEPVRPSWPEHGAIEYKDVQMRYRPGLPLVINGFSLQIRAGESIGIVGRTGAGKSTILSTLFRLTEIAGGSITIDGIDISKLGLHQLRSSLAIIPQDPTLFHGTVRSNIDPFNKHTDLELWAALRRAHLNPMPQQQGSQGGDRERINEEMGSNESLVTLDAPVEAEGLNFSVGQRQLIALARALLRETKIVLVDEGTSSVDPETVAKVQETLATGLRGKTLVAIAHRLRTVIRYDRVCVMDKGAIVELGSPLHLWKQGSIFRGLCDSNGISEGMFIGS